MTFQPPESPARPPPLVWIEEAACGTEASFRELVGGAPTAMSDRTAQVARMYGRVCLPARLAADRSVHGGCVIIDDPIDPGSERYQQARRGVPYPRGTRAQRRRTATARVQARRRKARAAKAALAAWRAAGVRTDPGRMAPWPTLPVPTGPYDPPPFVPVYYGVTVPVHPAFRVTCV